MITPKFFYDTLASHDIDFYAGVPDSLLKNLCAYITDYADAAHNIIAANEGGAMGLAVGHYLAQFNSSVDAPPVTTIRI